MRARLQLSSFVAVLAMVLSTAVGVQPAAADTGNAGEPEVLIEGEFSPSEVQPETGTDLDTGAAVDEGASAAAIETDTGAGAATDGAADIDESNEAEPTTTDEIAEADVSSPSGVPFAAESYAASAGNEPKFSSSTTRLKGKDRYETAVQAAKRYGAGVPAVFVATGRDFPDALSAASAAALLGGPLLLTESRSLPKIVRNEIQRLSPDRIYVVGGTGAVSGSVTSALKSIAPVKRLGGSSRYSTGLNIVNSIFTKSNHAIIATGSSFPDALAATGAAGARKAPVILVDGRKSSLDSATRNTLKRLGVKSVAIAGGKGVVSTGIESQLRKSYSVKRYGKSDRYGTAAAINAAYFPAGSSDTMFLATGTNFPDALAGAALAGRLAAPLYITTRTCLPAPIHTQVSRLGAPKQVIMGGTGAVASAAAKHRKCAPGPVVSGEVTSGAYCKKEHRGRYGYTSGGVLMQCKTSTTDSRLRWRAA